MKNFEIFSLHSVYGTGKCRRFNVKLAARTLKVIIKIAAVKLDEHFGRLPEREKWKILSRFRGNVARHRSRPKNPTASHLTRKQEISSPLSAVRFDCISN